MTLAELSSLLDRIRGARIGIVGDFCLDAYLLVDPAASEISLETGLATRPVRSQRYTLGGAGNVVQNLFAMGVQKLSAFAVIGEDPFGEEMRRLLSARGVSIDGLLVQRENWATHVYMKPYEQEREQHRFDFGNFNDLHPSTADALLRALESALPDLDIVIINQQVMRGLHTVDFRKRLSALIQQNPPGRFIVDSRHFTDHYPGALRKLNILEGARLFGRESSIQGFLDARESEELARMMFERWERPVFVTRGELGCVIYDASGFHEIPGLLILSPIDSVGAGDSMMAGIASALAVGSDAATAAELGTLVAGVTVQKLMQTGTASPDEILALGADPDFRYRPDLAQHPRRATFLPGSEIEVVSALPRQRRFTHVIFDHDGTLSTLREGWEQIMEPMMLHAILGGKEGEAAEALYEHVRSAVRDFIDKTTGIQTLVQMKGLVSLVRRFKCVPELEILDEHGYKRIYNEALLNMVQERMEKLRRGELAREDFTIKKASEFVRALHERGMILYLASGTDQEDLEREAETLGYGKLFGGRIYGAVGDMTREAKRIVLEKIHADIGDDVQERVLTFGDGPVEIRETHKRHGYTVGIASNEVRRHGLNSAKRRRLIEAGADLVVPDFCQMDTLCSVLFG